jgi:hypothetical protein
VIDPADLIAAARELHPHDREAAMFAAYEIGHQLAEALGDGDPPEPWELLMAAGR